MALKVDFDFKGIPVFGAYAEVAHTGFSAARDEHYFTLIYRASKGAPEFHAHGYVAPYALDGANPYIQAYTYLKTLPEFAGAVDVLEE